MKEFFANIGLSVLSILVALIVGEGFAYYFDTAPEVGFLQKGRYRLSSNPEIGYEPVPGFVPPSKDLHLIDYLDTSSALGYRSGDYPEQKPYGTTRLIVLGDSITAGWGIEAYQDTFPGLLESQLGDRNVQVVSFGVTGYNTLQEVATLEERGLAYDPDIVILQYSENDTYPMSGILHSLVKETHGITVSSPFVHSLLVHSELARTAAFSVFRSILFHPPEYYRFEGGEEDTAVRALQRLEEIKRKEGFRLHIVGIPNLESLEANPNHATPFPLKFGFYQDLAPALVECSKEKPVRKLNDPWHPNVYGHRCIANEIVKILRSDPDLSGRF